MGEFGKSDCDPRRIRATHADTPTRPNAGREDLSADVSTEASAKAEALAKEDVGPSLAEAERPVRHSFSDVGTHVLVSVGDSGPGLDPDALDHLFELCRRPSFEQVRNALSGSRYPVA